MSKLTKSVVDAATPREKQFTIWCNELKGFGLFVQPSGSRTYFVDYRNRDGVRKRMTIGRHGAITAEQARKLAIATLGETVKGQDPADERIRQRKALTVKELCERYLVATLYRSLAISASRASSRLTSINLSKMLPLESLRRSRRQIRSVASLL